MGRWDEPNINETNNEQDINKLYLLFSTYPHIELGDMTKK